MPPCLSWQTHVWFDDPGPQPGRKTRNPPSHFNSKLDGRLRPGWPVKLMCSIAMSIWLQSLGTEGRLHAVGDKQAHPIWKYVEGQLMSACLSCNLLCCGGSGGGMPAAPPKHAVRGMPPCASPLARGPMQADAW